MNAKFPTAFEIRSAMLMAKEDEYLDVIQNAKTKIQAAAFAGHAEVELQAYEDQDLNRFLEVYLRHYGYKVNICAEYQSPEIKWFAVSW